MPTDLQKLYLTNILATAMVLECMDELKETTGYRHAVKNSGNRFYNELLAAFSKDIADIWGIDDRAMYSLITAQRKVISELATLRPEDIAVIQAIIEKYKQTPAKILRRMELKIVDSSDCSHPSGNGVAACVKKSIMTN